MPEISIVRKRILYFFRKLGRGIPISVRALFCFGKETQVYKIASNLAKELELTRVAWGVYMLPNQNGSLPTKEVVALAKAQGFGKIVFNIDDIINQSGGNLKIIDADTIACFATSGAGSCFKYNGGKIVFLKMANRKIQLLQDRMGKAFTSFWKRFTHSKSEMEKSFEDLQVTSVDKVRTPKLLELMPLWLKTNLRENFSELPWELSIDDALSHISSCVWSQNKYARTFPG